MLFIAASIQNSEQKQEGWAIQRWPRAAPYIWCPETFRVTEYAHGYFSPNF